MPQDETKNRNPVLPKFDVKKGRIEMSVFRMNTGYLVIDQDSGTRHALTDEVQIQDMLKKITGTLAESLIDKLAELNLNDFVDLTIVLESKEEDLPLPDPYEPEPTSMDLGQLTLIINDIMSGGGDPTGLRPRAITPTILESYMRSPRYVKITKKTRIVDSQGKGHSPHDNKIFHDGNKNKPPQGNKDQGQGGDPKPTEVK